MALHLTAGTTVSYTLPAGLTLTLTGVGLAQLSIFGIPQVYPISAAPVYLGPYPIDRAVSIRSEAGGPMGANVLDLSAI